MGRNPRRSEPAATVTWHYYPQQSRRCPLAELRAEPGMPLDPERLANVSTWAALVEAERDDHVPAAPVWLGETGGAQCGGEPDLNDAFVGSFWWLDQLGLMALRGQPVVIRQSLSDGSYGLLDEDTLEPRPDYYSSVLHRRLLGSKVLQAGAADELGLTRAYAHCTATSAPGYEPGGVTLVLLNLSVTHAAAVSPEESLDTAGALLWLLTAPALSSHHMLLNGAELWLQADGSLPSLDPLPLPAGPLILPPASFAFVSLPRAAIAPCLPR